MRKKQKLFSSNYIIYSLFFLLILTAGILFLWNLQKQDTPVSKTGFYFDTVITITLYESENSADSLLTDCFSLCEKYENLLSRTKEGSDIYRINHAHGTPVTVDEKTISVLQTALTYARQSDGIVDPTIAPVSSLWDFSTQCTLKEPHVPDDKEIQKLLQHVDYNCIQISGNTVTLLDSEAQIDLGFIAKGFIADELKSYLLSQGVKSGIINLGGNVLTIGCKPSGEAYQIGIQKPFDAQNTAMFSIPVTDSSVVSSGCYERYFYLENTLYHHILDTSTGYPVKNELLSVSILSSSSIQGDALSTLCYALGLEDAMTLMEKTPDAEAIFILNDDSIVSTSGAKSLINIKP